MARTVTVYPKAELVGSQWQLVTSIGDSECIHFVAAGVTATADLVLLKVVFDLVLDDGDLDSDVDDALFLDDIQPGPQIRTAWGNWVILAEGIIDGLDPGYTEYDFRAAWTGGDTQAVRNDFNRALVAGPGGIGRGWTVVAGSIHQHEGDGTVTRG